MDAIMLFFGLVVLIAGANALVMGASEVAARLQIAPLIVGLTIVSFGTSLPELLVSLLAGLQKKPDLAIANVIGSNIANVLLVLGVAAIVRPLSVRNSTIVSEIPFSLAAALLIGFLANAALFSNDAGLSISRIDGAILLFFFLLFMLYAYSTSGSDAQDEPVTTAGWSVARSAAWIVVGIVALYLGGEWSVRGALGLAREWQVDNALIGLTVVALGTSAPELFASAVAAWRGQCDLAVGNVVGSNIFNLLWILGLTSSIVELPFRAVGNIDLLLVVASSALLILAVAVSRRRALLRWHGVVFLFLYAGYVAYLFS